MPANWTDHRAEYIRMAREVSDVIRLTTKDGPFWQVAATVLSLLSFGRMPRRRFLDEFASTLGPIQAYPRQWRELPPTLIAHEGRHVHQFLFAGWFVPIVGWLGRRVRVWAGVLPMAIVYGFFPLPVFLAWGRYRLELDAEAYSWQQALQRRSMTADQVRTRARQFARMVSSWAYLKAWPQAWAVAAFEQRAEQIIRAERESLPVDTSRP